MEIMQSSVKEGVEAALAARLSLTPETLKRFQWVGEFIFIDGQWIVPVRESNLYHFIDEKGENVFL